MFSFSVRFCIQPVTAAYNRAYFRTFSSLITELWGWRTDETRNCVGVTKLEQTSCGFGFALSYTENRSNALILSDQTNRERTLDVPFMSSCERIQSVDCGRCHALLLSSQGHVYSCGHNPFGQCGYSSYKDINKNIETSLMSPVDYIMESGIKRVDSLKERIVQVACGLDHSLFLDEKGVVYSCGWGADGQTGIGHYNDETIPQQVEGDLQGRRVKQIATSTDCSLALTSDGIVCGWGNSEYQQLGLDTTEMQVAVPSVISGKLFEKGRVVMVAAGGSFCLFLTSVGAVYSIGYGAGLGLDDEIQSTSIPKEIRFDMVQGQRIGQIHASVDYAAAVTNDGRLYVWGHNRHKQLGPYCDHLSDVWRPALVKLPYKIETVHLGIDCMSVTRQLTQ